MKLNQRNRVTALIIFFIIVKIAGSQNKYCHNYFDDSYNVFIIDILKQDSIKNFSILVIKEPERTIYSMFKEIKVSVNDNKHARVKKYQGLSEKPNTDNVYEYNTKIYYMNPELGKRHDKRELIERDGKYVIQGYDKFKLSTEIEISLDSKNRIVSEDTYLINDGIKKLYGKTEVEYRTISFNEEEIIVRHTYNNFSGILKQYFKRLEKKTENKVEHTLTHEYKMLTDSLKDINQLKYTLEKSIQYDKQNKITRIKYYDGSGKINTELKINYPK